jgi:hypothetical protein
MNKIDFVNSVSGKLLDLKAIACAYRCFESIPQELDVATLVDQQLATSLYAIIDSFDHNGSPDSVSSQLALQMIQCIFIALGEPDATSTAKWDRVARAGARSIIAKQGCHWHTLNCRGVGTYYGDHSPFDAIGESSEPISVKVEKANNLLPPNWKTTYIDYMKAKIVGPDSQKSLLRESSCIGWVLENTEDAYCRAGLRDRWSVISHIVRDADQTGDSLCRELQKDGWLAVRFKADSVPSEGEGSMYEGVRVDYIVGDYELPESRNKLMQISKAMFFVGMFNRGSHTFVGSKGDLITQLDPQPPCLACTVVHSY